MPNDTTNIPLLYDRTRLDGLRMEGQIWLRDHQIGAPLGFAHNRAVLNLYNRHSDEFTADETRLILEQTGGGSQQVRVFSTRGALLLTILARTPPAARFRRWLLDLLEGKAPVSAKPTGDLLETVEGPPRLADHPMVRAAIQTALEASADIAMAFRAAREKNRRARRQAALAGLSARELKILVERERSELLAAELIRVAGVQRKAA